MEPTEQQQEASQDETPDTEAGPRETAVVEEAGPPGAAEEPEAARAESEEPPAASQEAGPETAEPPAEAEVVPAEQLLPAAEAGSAPAGDDARLKAMLEAVIYVTEEPLPLAQLAAGLEQPRERIQRLLEELIADYENAARGIAIREVAGGYKMATKPEHHDAVRAFVKRLKPPLKLSLAALETLAVIAYKQPVTAPEIMEIRGVQGAGVLKTLLDRKLITTAGRKNVIGKPILYRTSKEFLVQFGLKDLSELPSLKEFEELRRLAISDTEPEEGGQEQPAEAAVPEPAESAPAGSGDRSPGAVEEPAPPAAAEEPESGS